LWHSLYIVERTHSQSTLDTVVHILEEMKATA
jgi:hypothetical protein